MTKFICHISSHIWPILIQFLLISCTVCEYLAVELQGRLDETGKTRGYIETGHGLDNKKKKKTEYKKS